LEARTTRPLGTGLRGILGLGFGLAVIVGGTLGVGILRVPGIVAGELHTGPRIISAWVIGGAYTLIAAICMTELGGRSPRAGGYYVYARRAFGDLVGFAVGWMDWVAYCAALGYVAIGMAEFVAVLVPPLSATRPIAIAILVGVVVLQETGTRISGRFQEWTTVLKSAAFLALVGAGLVLAGTRERYAPDATPGELTASGLATVCQVIAITYGGWQSALYFSEEDRDSRRNLPRAMIGGVVAVTVMYVLVNVALLAILPMPILAHSTLPASDAAEHLVGLRGGQLITVLSLISLPPLLNAVMMIGTRILFAIGRDRLVWSRAAEVSATGTPTIAARVTAIVAIGLVATGSFQRLGGVSVLFLMVACAVCSLALIALRRRDPAPASFRAWGYPVSPAIVIAGSIAFVVGVVVGDPSTALTAGVVLGIGLVGYAAQRARSSGWRAPA
jgi:basic amino acid/polyamine antiporter, APA family